MSIVKCWFCQAPIALHPNGGEECRCGVSRPRPTTDYGRQSHAGSTASKWSIRNFEVGLFALCLLLLGCDAADCEPEPAANPCTIPALESGECPIIIESTAPNGEQARACNCIDLYTGGDFWTDCSAPSCSACCEAAGGHFFPQCPGGPEC